MYVIGGCKISFWRIKCQNLFEITLSFSVTHYLCTNSNSMLILTCTYMTPDSFIYFNITFYCILN